jgi:hypothetical protein
MTPGALYPGVNYKKGVGIEEQGYHFSIKLFDRHRRPSVILRQFDLNDNNEHSTASQHNNRGYHSHGDKTQHDQRNHHNCHVSVRRRELVG